jgi:hypothetical protein
MFPPSLNTYSRSSYLVPYLLLAYLYANFLYIFFISSFWLATSPKNIVLVYPVLGLYTVPCPSSVIESFIKNDPSDNPIKP